MKLTTVFSTFSPAEAQLVLSMLKAAGVNAFINHEASALSMEGYSLATGGVIIQVPEDEHATARELIESKQTDEPS
ncbi:MAG: DUF2007 domain-containing protein [Verrucomicrobia bacterium]|nr:DUF2007 domain-containing protein [Verrucomicrobiota bacterium]MCF7709134.1 DUF2007 domain-containing protein [Verrucomicrobiota bacterium]